MSKIINYQLFDSPIGSMLITAGGNKIRHIYFEDCVDLNALQALTGPLIRDSNNAVLHKAIKQLNDYFLGKTRLFTLPLAPHGTEFQQSVWAGLQKIAYAATWSYADLANYLNKPTATRAVGSANGQNPISIVIPCHRVIGKNGSLTGYAGTIERKAWLLDHERAVAHSQAPVAN